MKPNELDIVQWSELMRTFRQFDKIVTKMCPPAMRCENTQLTTGWHCGGFTMNGHVYTAFCPRAVHGPCAMLAVRDDFLKWVEKFLKEQSKQESKRNSPAVEQTELPL